MLLTRNIKQHFWNAFGISVVSQRWVGQLGIAKHSFYGIFNPHVYKTYTTVTHLHTFTIKPMLSVFGKWKKQSGAKPTSGRYRGNKLYPMQKCKNRNFVGNHTIITILNALQRRYLTQKL